MGDRLNHRFVPAPGILKDEEVCKRCGIRSRMSGAVRWFETDLPTAPVRWTTKRPLCFVPPQAS